MDSIHESIQKFNYYERKDDIIKWEKGMKGGYSGIHGFMEGVNNSLFSHWIENNITHANTLFENEQCVIIRPDPSTSMQLEGLKSRMAFDHILVIPKKRIYNAVTIKYEQIPLIHDIIHIGENVLHENYEKASCASSRDCLSFLAMVSGQKIENISIHDLRTPIFIENKKQKRVINHCVHLFPHNSIGQLHIHMWTQGLETLNDLSCINIDIFKVLDNIKNECSA